MPGYVDHSSAHNFQGMLDEIPEVRYCNSSSRSIYIAI